MKQLQNQLDSVDVEEHPQRGLKLDEIITTLNSLIDFSGTKISHDVINQFAYMVTPTSDTVFYWYVNLSGTADVKAIFTAEGRKNRAVIKLEEIEKISSLHRKENEDNSQFLKTPCICLSAQVAVNALWILLDIIILNTYFKYGKKEWPEIFSPKLFAPWSVLILICCSALQIVFIEEFGFVMAAQNSAFLQNLLMSVMFISMFVRRGDMEGQSLLLGIFQKLGKQRWNDIKN